MSSGTSTDKVRLQPEQADSLQPWQLFVLAALGCATAATFMARGQGITKVVLIAAIMASAALVGLAALRALRPLVTSDEDRTSMIGARTRAALEREKFLILRSIKELEFDSAMGKVSEVDSREMAGRLRSRAARIMRQLDAGSGYRDRIERTLAERLAGQPGPRDSAPERIAPACAACSTINDVDARFCKSCGQKL